MVGKSPLVSFGYEAIYFGILMLFPIIQFMLIMFKHRERKKEENSRKVQQNIKQTNRSTSPVTLAKKKSPIVLKIKTENGKWKRKQCGKIQTVRKSHL